MFPEGFESKWFSYRLFCSCFISISKGVARILEKGGKTCCIIIARKAREKCCKPETRLLATIERSVEVKRVLKQAPRKPF